MAERFELSELDDVATFLELVEEGGTTAFITIGGRDRFAVMPVEECTAAQTDAVEEEEGEAPAPMPAAAPSTVESAPYETAVLPNTPIDSDDYQRSMWHDAILDRMRKVMAAEAPVERQRLFNAVRASFGIKRSGRDIQSHNEWLFNRAIECKTTEFNGSTFVWTPDQDPATYALFRVSNEESGRQITEVPYEELANAMKASLAGGKALSRDELIEAAMRALGYKRKTTRVREVVGAAIERAAEDGVVRLFSDGTFRAAPRSAS